MSLIFIGDLHLKDKEPFLSSAKKFFNWLDEKFPQDNLFFLGDTTDSSSPHWTIFSLFSNFLVNRKTETYILGGNHDYSKLKGSVLDGLKHIESVEIILDRKVIKYCDSDILCLPFKYGKMKEEYERLIGEYSFIATHTTPRHLAFSDEGIDYKNLKGTFIHGHTHVTDKSSYQDNNNLHITIEVPFPTRNGEQKEFHRIIILNNDGTYRYEKVPFYFTYETIEFGKFPESKNNILNIINAPDSNSVFEMYKDYYIREDGIELKRTEIDGTEQFVFNIATIKDQFNNYCLENGISKEVLKCGLKYLETF